MSSASRIQPIPAVLRLVQTAVLGRWRASVETLYRELADLLEAAPGRDVLVSGCGDGRNAEWLAARTGASVIGVDPDAARMRHATERMLSAAAPVSVSFQVTTLDELPFDDAVLDGAVGEPVLAAVHDPARAVSELARVVEPYAPVVLCLLTWNSDFDQEDRAAVIERLGLGLRHLVEWKQMMREAGLVDIEVQDWTDRGTRGRVDAVPSFTLGQRLQIVSRAWRRRGWRAAREAVEKETSLLRHLSQERAIGFHVVRGVKRPHPMSPWRGCCSLCTVIVSYMIMHSHAPTPIHVLP